MISIFSDYTQADSLFQKMTSMGAPWSTQQAMSMDMSYFMVHSGLKTPSSFVTLNLQPNGSPNAQRIAQILWDMFGQNWKRLWDAYNLQYNPIDNYNLKETVVRDQTDDRTIEKDGSANQNTTDSGDSTLQHGETITNNRTINNSRFGFNSTDGSPTDSQVSTGSESHGGSDKTTTTSSSKYEGTSKDSTIDNNITNENITRTRAGNVGQNSYQELLGKEFELWKWNFFNAVFEDCDSFLCLSVYDPCSSVN